MSIGTYDHGIPVFYPEITPVQEFYDYVETVTTEGKTTFTISGVTLTSAQKIDVSVDGRDEPIEGTNWTRNVSANQIILSDGIHVDSVFKARIYLL